MSSSNPVPEEPASSKPTPSTTTNGPDSGVWGIWQTVMFAILIGIAAIAVQVLLMFIAMAIAVGRQGDAFDVDQFTKLFQTDGDYLGISTIATMFVVVPLIIVFVRLKKGISVKDYLGLKRPSVSTLLKWCGVLVLFVAAMDTLTFFLGREVVPAFMTQSWGSSGWKVLLCLAVLVAAPISEEFFFRGFLFKGLSCSRLGTVGAIVITSAIWAATHLQYDLWGIFYIFLGGLLLGYTRWKTDSIWVSVGMHALMNAIATAELLVVLALA